LLGHGCGRPYFGIHHHIDAAPSQASPPMATIAGDNVG
jgi:hypothetical protein